jgi:hypothetical protein
MTSPATNRQFLLEFGKATLETLQSASPLRSKALPMCRSEPRFSDMAEPARIEGNCEFHLAPPLLWPPPELFTTSLSGVMLRASLDCE